MAGFTKLFSCIVDSTIWRESKETKIVWITMLAKADRRGVVEAAVPGLADAARVTVPECREAVKVLCSPDPDSRSKEHEGRRIKEIDGGWQILNYSKYRAKLSKEERLEYQREWDREHRRDKSDTHPTKSDKSDTVRLNPTHAEAEAEADSRSKEGEREARPHTKTSDADALTFEMAWGWAQEANKTGADYTIIETRDAFFLCQQRGWKDGKDRLTADYRATLFRQISYDRGDKETKRIARANGRPFDQSKPQGKPEFQKSVERLVARATKGTTP